jgi:sugar diacid utilization regulator
VRELLGERLFRGRLAAGEAGVSNIVAWCVPVLEPHAQDLGGTPDEELEGVAAYVECTPAVEGDAGVLLVGRLADRGASALLLRCRDATHPAGLEGACRAADDAGLPLLMLPPEAGFREVSRLIATKVLAQSTHVLEYGTRIHRTLGDVFARGGGLPALAHTMAQLSGTTVLIMSTSGELLTSAVSAGVPGSPDALTAEVRGQLHLVDAPRPIGADEESHHARTETLTLDVDAVKTHVIVTPVEVAGEPYGFLALVEPGYPADEHDLSQHTVIAEQGVSLTASELLRQHSIREAEERARNDFVHALLHGRFTDRLELAARAEHYRFPLEGHFAVFVVSASGLRPDDSSSRRKAHDAARLAVATVPDDGRLTLGALIGSMIVVVREIRPAGASAADAAKEAAESRAFAKQLHRTMGTRVGQDVRVSFGRPDQGAPGVARSYREARTADALARWVSRAPVASYADLRVFAAIQEAAKSEAGRAFAADVLAPLKQSDGQTGHLEEVVLAYIEESGNLNATARRLHLHRNTMLYKLDRASRALQMDLRTTEAQFMVWLAHHITALSDVERALDRELAPPR